jgi:hypothetical protein
VIRAVFQAASAFPCAFARTPEYRSRRPRALLVWRNRLDLRLCRLVLAVPSSGWCRGFIRSPSSHALSLASGIFPPQSSLRFAPKHAFVLLEPLARPAQTLAPPVGPYDANQPALTRPSVSPCGSTPTGRVYLPQLDSCRGSASHISDWIVHGHPPFRGFSPFVAARPSRVLQSPLPFLTLRPRGSEDFSSQRDRHLAAPVSLVPRERPRKASLPRGCAQPRHRVCTHLTSGCVLRRRRCSRHRRVAPLLVVSPLRG